MNLADKSAADKIREWRDRPQQMVRELFGVTPDPWQDEILAAFPNHQRMAMKSAKGPGKTALLAWLSWGFLLTRPFPKCAATSIDGNNLRDNFWSEMAKWRNKSELLKAQFEWTAKRIFARKHPEEWWMSARTWQRSADSSQQANTLAGLHADYILFVLDESGGIHDAVMASAEAALSSCKEGHIIQAGNPTHLSGPLYRAATSERKLWHVVEITGDPDNPMRSPRISVQWARDQIEKYGRNSPWVLVNVFGQFPPSSLNSLIGPDEVAEAMRRFYRPYEIGDASKVLGIDVARFGDDSSIIFPRQGIQCFPLTKKRGLDSTQGAGLVSRIWDDFGADAAFIDMTGGWGTGWYDRLIVLGKAPIGVQFAGEAHNKARYYNKRAEMAFDAVEWIKRGGALPPEDSDGAKELAAALTTTTYTFQGDRLLLEPKDEIKIRLGYSPDEFDGFIETFAEPINATAGRRRRQQQNAMPANYDVFAGGDLGRAVQGSFRSEYDPFANDR